MTTYKPKRRAAAAFGALAALLLGLLVLDLVDFARTFSWLVLAGALALVAGLILAVYEVHALWVGQAPITYLERWQHARHLLVWPLIALVIGFSEGALSGHFWWSSCPPLP